MVKKIESYESSAVALQIYDTGTVFEPSPFWVAVPPQPCASSSSCSDLTGCIVDLFAKCAEAAGKTGLQINGNYKYGKGETEIDRALDRERERQIALLGKRTSVELLEGKKLILLEKPKHEAIWHMDPTVHPPAIFSDRYRIGVADDDGNWKPGDPKLGFNVGDDSVPCVAYSLPVVERDRQKERLGQSVTPGKPGLD